MSGERILDKIAKEIRKQVGDPILYNHFLVNIDGLMVLGIERFQELFEKYLSSSIRKKKEGSLEAPEGISKILNTTDPNFIENLDFYIEPPKNCCDYHDRVHVFKMSTEENLSDFLRIKIRGCLYKGAVIDLHREDYSGKSPIKMLTTNLAEGYPTFPFSDTSFFSGNDSMIPNKTKSGLVLGKKVTNASKKIKILEEAIQESNGVQDIFQTLNSIAKENNLTPLTRVQGYSLRYNQEKIPIYLGLATASNSKENIIKFAQGIVNFLGYLEKHPKNKFNISTPYGGESSWDDFSKKAKQGFSRIKQIKPLFDSYRESYNYFKKCTPAPFF